MLLHATTLLAVAVGAQAIEDRVDWLCKELQNGKTAAARTAAAVELRDRGSHAVAVVTALATALKDKEEAVRSETALALLWIGKDAAPAAEALSAALKDAAPEVRCRAAQALKCVGAETKAAEAAVFSLTDDRKPEVRELAFKTLLAIGDDGTQLAALRKLAKDSSDWTRIRIGIWIVEGFAEIGSMRPTLEQIVDDCRKAIRPDTDPALIREIDALRRLLNAQS